MLDTEMIAHRLKITILLAVLLMAIYATASFAALDPPHNPNIDYHCNDCHFTDPNNPPSWYDGPNDPTTDDTPLNRLCATCHQGGVAQEVMTHSAYAIGDYSYGTWNLECVECHNPHYQRQIRRYGSISYNYTGTSTNILIDQPVAGQSQLVEAGAGWTTDQWKDMVLIPDTALWYYMYRIAGNTADTITVDGIINATAGSTFAIAYGKNIKDVINFKNVKFITDYDLGANKSGFIQDDYTGICQVCHTQTSYWRTDGTEPTLNHNVNQACTNCHTHADGLKASGSCNTCHGNPPVVSTLGGPDGLADSEGGTGSTSPGAHQLHATSGNLNYSCETCHTGGMPTSPIYDKTIQIGFNAFNTYQTGTYDGRATLANGYTYGAGNAGTTVTQGGSWNCSNIYCHSNVQGQADGTGNPTSYGTPTWNNSASVQCGSCHNADGVQGNATLMATGTHTKHVDPATYNKTCSTCHTGAGSGTTVHVNNLINVSIDATYGGSYDGDGTGNHAPGLGYGGCSTTYCHSDAQATPTYTSPTWGGTLATDCTGCHKNNVAAAPNTMSSGGHTAHINDGTMMTNKTCDTCHASTVSGDRTIVSYTLHVNKTKDVTINATYDGDGTPNNNYSANQCSNLYCHSNATALSGPYSAPNTPATWGTTTNLGCSDCHTGPTTGPSYANGSPKANSHAKHTAAPWSFGCVKCHSSTVDATNAITTPANHLNKTYDVSGTDIGSYTYNVAGGTCSTIACHGGNNAQWGTTLSCSNCHLGTGDTDDYTFNNGTTAVVDSTQWTSSGHGRTTGTYTASGNPAANLSCEYCHDDTVAHGSGTNPFRLANYNVGANGWNDNCFVCHKTGSTGYDPDGAGPLALKNSSLKIDKYHYGAEHGATNDGGSLCFDCHDPHGDSNIYMVHANVTKDKADAYGTPGSTSAPVFTANTTGTDYAKSTAPFNGVCNVCHTTTNHYTSTSGDGHNSGTRCTTCHSHSGDTVVDGNAFSPSGGGACNSCHGYPPQQGDGFACQDDPVCEGKGAHTQHINNIASAKGVTLDPNNDSFGTGTAGIVCGTCHTNNSANHMSGTRVINFGDGSSVAEYEFVNGLGLTYNGVPGTSSNTNFKSCSNISCHFGESPGWQDPATAGP